MSCAWWVQEGEIDIIDVLYTNKLVEQALLDTVEPLSKDKMEAPL